MLSKTFLLSVLAVLTLGLVVRDSPAGVIVPKVTAHKRLAPTTYNGGSKGPLPDAGGSAPPPEEQLLAQQTYYLIHLGIGNKDQQRDIMLDTGSLDFWIGEGQLTDQLIWKKTQGNLDITYGDLLTVHAPYGQSDIILDLGITVKDVTWALADGSSDGVVGIGKTTGEATDQGTTYPNFVDSLKQQGFIKTNGYLYYFDEEDQGPGSIIFGGYDKAKVEGGNLVWVEQGPDTYHDLVYLSKLTNTDSSEVLGKTEVILDTGTTFTYIKQADYDVIVKQYEGFHTDVLGQKVVDCKQDSSKKIKFTFGEATIEASLQDLTVQAYNVAGDKLDYCVPAFMVDPRISYIFGDSFLKNAYIAVNHDAGKVGFGIPKKFSSKEIVAF